MMVGIDQSDMRSQVAMVVDSIVREREYVGAASSHMHKHMHRCCNFRN